MHELRFTEIAKLIFISVACASAGTQAAVTIRSAPASYAASSTYSADPVTYAVSGLFDGAITASDLDGTSNLGKEYACNGNNAPAGSRDLRPVVAMNFGGLITANSLVYAQRSRTAGIDKVTAINIWFQNFTPTTPVGDVTPTPAGSPDLVIQITYTVDQALKEYAFTGGTTRSFQFATVQFVNPGQSPIDNLGGYEFRFASDTSITPEPASLGMLAIGGSLALQRRRRMR